MKSNQFLDDFGKYNVSFSRSYAEKRAQALRDAQLIPKGVRGPHAPELNSSHMASLFIALVAADSDPVRSVTEYGSMPAISETWFIGADNFMAALVKMIENNEYVTQVQEIIICRSWPEASIVLKDGRKYIFSTTEPPSELKRDCRIEYRVGWRFLHSMHAHHITGQRPKPSKAGWERALKIKKIETEQGPEAAERWAKENLYTPEK